MSFTYTATYRRFAHRLPDTLPCKHNAAMAIKTSTSQKAVSDRSGLTLCCSCRTPHWALQHLPSMPLLQAFLALCLLAAAHAGEGDNNAAVLQLPTDADAVSVAAGAALDFTVFPTNGTLLAGQDLNQARCFCASLASVVLLICPTASESSTSRGMMAHCPLPRCCKHIL